MDLLRIRKSLGYTQADFAKKMGVSSTQIGRIERGLVKPSPTIVNKVMQLCEESGVAFVEKQDSLAAYHISRMYEK